MSDLKPRGYIFDTPPMVEHIFGLLDSEGLGQEVSRERVVDGIDKVLNNQLRQRQPWRDSIPGDAPELWYDAVRVSGRADAEDAHAKVIRYLIEFYCEEIAPNIPNNCWQMLRLHVTPAVVVVELGEDYRIWVFNQQRNINPKWLGVP